MEPTLESKVFRLLVAYVRDFARRVAATLLNYCMDKRLGIDTFGAYGQREEASLYNDDEGYVPTGYYTLKTMVNYLRLNKEDTFVDLGCGKGRVVCFIAATQQIRKVVGVELKGTLIRTAERNYRTLKHRKTRVEIWHGDAATYPIKDGTVFYLFNPFGAETLKRVVDNIKESLLSKPRRVQILYYYPVHKQSLDDTDWLVQEKVLRRGKILVWSGSLEE